MICSCDEKKIKIPKKQKEKIRKIRSKFNNLTDINPQLLIKTVQINKKRINVIQDAELIAGTKQRVAELFAQKIMDDKKINKYSILTYTGTFNGYGAVATAFASKRLGLKSEVFLNMIPIGKPNKSSLYDILKSRQINTLLALEAKIYICPTYRSSKTKQYSKTDYNPLYYNIPMGVQDDDDIMATMLAIQIRKALKGTKLEETINNNIVPRIWLVAGSGGIAKGINNAIRCEMFVYLTGGGRYLQQVKDYISTQTNITIMNDKQVDNTVKTYYDTVQGYDDKIIPYVEKYGENGDFIWNVAGESMD